MGNLARTVYAIRVGDHVELRACRTPLKAKVSKLTKTITTKAGTYVYDNELDYDRYVDRDVTKKVVLKQTFFIGGVVIGYTKHSTFTRLVKKVIHKDKPLLVTGDLAINILSPLWRKKNLW